ncbi:AhpD family alkylhydroperoxidase [Chryseobacterium ginsenosidimutans]|uniref:carboxymuconolactone decarboxylase family protein n=1 Tax=Chryseobacterium ginsenosidimutans TaxID=687846 RepID=UPI00216A3945|nr:carboxymuconolactone decarboxylase family protein [Chryseobacterium ginsenosidimutans]MCS3870315.1 AhpD family alkylhydroperoxidase [Chryseobacterium ginsenosidimutans]
MATRIKIDQVEPNGYKAILGLEKFIESTPLTKTHKDLIKIRASQINGCAFCIDMHTKEARKTGETEQRIYALNAWRDTPFFTEEERVILALTEEVTLISNHVKDETYEAAENILGQTYLAQVILAIITINAWNRIGITTLLIPAQDQ